MQEALAGNALYYCEAVHKGRNAATGEKLTQGCVAKLHHVWVRIDYDGDL